MPPSLCLGTSAITRDEAKRRFNSNFISLPQSINCFRSFANTESSFSNA